MQVEHKPGSGMIIGLDSTSKATIEELGFLAGCDELYRAPLVTLKVVSGLATAHAMINSSSSVGVDLPQGCLFWPVHIHNWEIASEPRQLVSDLFGEGDIIIRLLADEVE